jgi:hypothetical protein
MSWRDLTEELIDHTLAVDVGTLFMIHEVRWRSTRAARS